MYISQDLSLPVPKHCASGVYRGSVKGFKAWELLACLPNGDVWSPSMTGCFVARKRADELQGRSGHSEKNAPLNFLLNGC
jgi:hypothetical protein